MTVPSLNPTRWRAKLKHDIKEVLGVLHAAELMESRHPSLAGVYTLRALETIKRVRANMINDLVRHTEMGVQQGGLPIFLGGRGLRGSLLWRVSLVLSQEPGALKVLEPLGIAGDDWLYDVWRTVRPGTRDEFETRLDAAVSLGFCVDSQDMMQFLFENRAPTVAEKPTTLDIGLDF